jgi:hypothetical protein
VIVKQTTGLVLNEHIDEPGDVVSPRLQEGARRHRIEAPWLALPLQPLAVLGQEQEPAAPAVKREAEEDWGSRGRR